MVRNNLRSRAVVGLLVASLWLGSVSVAAGAGVSGATSAADLLLRLMVWAVGMAGALVSLWSALFGSRPKETGEERRLAPVRVTVPVLVPPRRRTRRG